jgi:hypothetical protein
MVLAFGRDHALVISKSWLLNGERRTSRGHSSNPWTPLNANGAGLDLA